MIVIVLAQCAVMLVVITILIYFYGYDDESRSDPDTIKAILFILGVTAALTAVMLLVTHFINRRSYRKKSD